MRQSHFFRIFVPLKCGIINFKIGKDKATLEKTEAKQDAGTRCGGGIVRFYHR